MLLQYLSFCGWLKDWLLIWWWLYKLVFFLTWVNSEKDLRLRRHLCTVRTAQAPVTGRKIWEQCKVYSAQSTLHSAQCPLHKLQPHSTQYTIHSAQCALRSTQCTLWTEHCTVRTGTSSSHGEDNLRTLLLRNCSLPPCGFQRTLGLVQWFSVDQSQCRWTGLGLPCACLGSWTRPYITFCWSITLLWYHFKCGIACNSTLHCSPVMPIFWWFQINFRGCLIVPLWDAEQGHLRTWICSDMWI